MYMNFNPEVSAWYNEWKELQDRIVKENVHHTDHPEKRTIIMRVKELHILLKKAGYFR